MADQLSRLSGGISCGVSSLYNAHESISYNEICSRDKDACDMMDFGNAVLGCTISACILYHLSIGVSLFIILFRDRTFMQTRIHKALSFVGYVGGGVVTFFGITAWDGRNPSKCNGACTYLNETYVCNGYENGVSQNL